MRQGNLQCNRGIDIAVLEQFAVVRAKTKQNKSQWLTSTQHAISDHYIITVTIRIATSGKCTSTQPCTSRKVTSTEFGTSRKVTSTETGTSRNCTSRWEGPYM